MDKYLFINKTIVTPYLLKSIRFQVFIYANDTENVLIRILTFIADTFFEKETVNKQILHILILVMLLL
jgi:hypothetical protein